MTSALFFSIMKKIFFIALRIMLGGLCVGINAEAAAEDIWARTRRDKDPAVTLAVQSGYLAGDTTYHINSYTGSSGVESELEFPLETYVLGVSGEIGGGQEERGGLAFGFSWLRSLGGDAGKLRDSDWLTDDIDIAVAGSAHPGKDIYSESKADLTANILDVRLAYDFRPAAILSLGLFGGYRYHHFEYDVTDVYQIGYGPYAALFSGFVPGRALSYDVKYRLSYGGISAGVSLSKWFRAVIEVGYSPWASAEDRDDHILRYKLSKAQTDGRAVLGGLSLQWIFSPNNALELNGAYLDIDTTGKQNQFFYAGPYAGSGTVVEDRITSSLTSVVLRLTHQL